MSADNTPQSALTLHRPDIWARGLALATDLTGYIYAPKLPLPDGTIYACGAGAPLGGGRTVEEIEEKISNNKKIIERGADEEGGEPHSPDRKAWWENRLLYWERLRREKEELRKKEIADTESAIKRLEESLDGFDEENDASQKIDNHERWLRDAKEALEKLKKGGLSTAPTVNVPEGAMEWLLHEVGHYVASTPAERLKMNYGVGQNLFGHDADREWQAWAFEDMVLSPFGTSRLFAPPSQQTGVCFMKAGGIPHQATRHAELQVRDLGIDIGQWQALYGEWTAWDARGGR